MMMRVRTVLLLGLVAAALAGCGSRGALAPLQGRTLPPAPHGRDDKPTADALLVPPVQAKPERSVELRSRSQDREDDAFDLPPEN
jgi:hypothetical protein